MQPSYQPHYSCSARSVPTMHGQKKPIGTNWIISPPPASPDVSANSCAIVFHRKTAARTPKHMWVQWEDRSIRWFPSETDVPHFDTFVEEKFLRKLKRNDTKQIHVNNVFPYLTLDLDFRGKRHKKGSSKPKPEICMCYRCLSEHGFRALIDSYICVCDNN